MSSPVHFTVVLAAFTLLAMSNMPLTTAGRNCRGPNSRPAPTTWNWANYPNPRSPNQNQQLQCCRSGISSVCDPNGLISDKDASDIDRQIEEVYADTRCTCNDCTYNNHGYVIRVALMEKMTPVFNYTARNFNRPLTRLHDAHRYAYQVSRQWNMDGACNETLLILYSRQDSILFTLTRSETRKKLTDRLVGDVSLSVRHHFDNEATIGEGIKGMINRYKSILSQDAQPRTYNFNSRG